MTDEAVTDDAVTDEAVTGKAVTGEGFTSAEETAGPERERSVVFGEAVDAYETARPGYPDQLVDDVLTFAGPGPVLEVGAGTGKATVSFAARGLDLTCVEPDPRMAASLRRNCEPYPAVAVTVSAFESWTPDRRYGLLYSAQAWHWIDPERRVDLAYAALAPGGALALFWNIMLPADAGLLAALAAVEERHGFDGPSGPHTRHAAHAGEIDDIFGDEWPTLNLAGDNRFTDLRSRRYRGGLAYETAGYVELLTTLSAYRMLTPDQRAATLSDVAEVIDAHGGTVEVDVVTDLALARRGSDAN